MFQGSETWPVEKERDDIQRAEKKMIRLICSVQVADTVYVTIRYDQSCDLEIKVSNLYST